MLKGFEELAADYRDLPNLMTTCTSIQDDVATMESWASVFLEPAADLNDLIHRNIKRHIIGLTADVAAARKDWNNGEFFAFGEVLGEMLVIVTS